MSTAREGWYVDPSTGTNLRYWNGTTWTEEVAPLPIATPSVSQVVESPVEQVAAEEPPAQQITAEEPPAQQVTAEEPPAEQVAAAPPEPDVLLPLEPDLEHTRLTRRELRARRGTDPALDDSPKHLPPPPPPPAPSAEVHAANPEEAEIAVTESPPADDSRPDSPKPSRRASAVRLSVLLGILAIASTVAVFTTGAL